MTDFFISYTRADRSWAEWIASVLEAAKFSVVIQAWDFRPGGNFVVEMQKAAAGSARTIAVMSPDYLRSLYGMAEWAAAFAADPDGSKGKLVPVVVRKTALEGLLAPIINIYLVGLTEPAAREALIQGLAPGRIRPENVRFPGAHRFPGSAPSPPDPEAAKAALSALPLEEVPLPGPLPVGSRMPLAPNPLFVGREEDLKTLARQLKAGETSAVGQVEISAATGLGGMGKTQLASEFVHRYGRFFAGGAFWMRFADASSVSVEVAACGQGLGLSSNFETITLEQQVRLVQEAWQSPLPRLLVFDNCEEESLLVRWRPTSGGSRVLVTSRRPEWNPSLGIKTVPLTTLPRPASIELLRRFRPDVPETEPALDGIADELGDLPLALHLAGSFLQTYRASASGKPSIYLETLGQKNLEHPSLQGRGSGALPTEHERHVGRTFALTFEKLNPSIETDALAIDLLARAAWFASGEPISRSTLIKTLKKEVEGLMEELLTEDALRRLMDLGLIEANDRNDLLMHRLVAAWARSIAKGDEARSAVEEAILAEAHHLNKASNPALLLALRPHLRSVTDRALERQDLTAAHLSDELGIYLWGAGDYSGARPYLEGAVAIHLMLSGPESPDTANSLNHLGLLLHSKGEYEQALPYFERGLAIRERNLGPNHSDTAQSLNDLGILLRAQGDFKGARQYLERALAIREHLLGPEHPDTAISLDNLGFLLQGGEGQPAAALPYFERALAIRERVLGPRHPDTANSLNNLASLLQDQKDYHGARRYYERALEIRERALGPEHPETANSLNNIGSLIQGQGSLEDARRYFERALEINKKALGIDHPDTAISFSNLGVVLQGQGELKEARINYERALEIQKEILGPEHPDTAQSLLNLGSLYLSQGNFARARWHLEQAFRIFKGSLGPTNETTKETRRRLGLLPGAGPSRKSGPKKAQ
jgi:tetratricopeptide (TPR) repeat protein